jgi:DNA repair protein RecN (Recombination protein N)
MLEHITIQNLALIEDMEIDFTSGFTVLTGETGAGKSIILGALSLLMGDKADGNLVRSGSEEASVAAVFSLSASHPLVPWLAQRDITLEDESIIIRRVVKKSGRGSITMQSTPITRSDLALVSDMLFDMHGQHEHQSLLHSDRQRAVLDNYGKCFLERTSYTESYHKLEEVRKSVEQLEHNRSQRIQEIDYLTFVVDELDRAQLKEHEDELLEEEISLLSQYETIHENLEFAHEQLKSSSGDGALSAINLSLSAIRRAEKADSSLDELTERMQSVFLELQDLSEGLRDRLSAMSFSQQRLDELQMRLAQLQRLKKKYGPSLDQVIAFYTATKEKLVDGEQSDEDLKELKAQLAKLDIEVTQRARILTLKRTAAAGDLQQEITRRLQHLGMEHVVFSIEITEKERTIHGSDRVDFWFSANLGEPKRSLREIASGGELSRVMLAVKTVLAEADDVETLVFDEVDAGIGGAVALAVGEQMAELSQSRQIIAITHLASIAAKASQHLVVHKETDGERTYTRIHQVDHEQRIVEIARMLSGHHTDERALEHARSLLQ